MSIIPVGSGALDKKVLIFDVKESDTGKVSLGREISKKGEVVGTISRYKF